MDDAFLLAYSSYLIRGDQRIVRRHLRLPLWYLRHSEFVRCLTDLASNDGTRARTWTQTQVRICTWTHPIDPTDALNAIPSLDTRVMLLDGSIFVKWVCSMFRSSQICLVMRKATKRISWNASQGWRIQFRPQNGCVWHSSITGTISDWNWFSSLILKHNSNPYRMKYYTTLLIKAPIINTLYKERSP